VSAIRNCPKCHGQILRRATCSAVNPFLMDCEDWKFDVDHQHLHCFKCKTWFSDKPDLVEDAIERTRRLRMPCP
jgi:hypothetical protein